MKRLLMLSAATLCAGLLLTGCTAFINKTEVTTEEKVTTLKPVQTPEPVGQTEVFDALAGESILGVVILNPTQAELDLAGNVDQVYPDQEYGEYMLIVPKLPGSTITLQEISYDTNTGEITDIQDVHTTKYLAQLLRQVGVCLVDHFVIAEDEMVSMRESGYLTV